MKPFLSRLTVVWICALNAALWITPAFCAERSDGRSHVMSPEWIGEIERSIQESEYHVTWQDQTVLPDLKAAWQAPNRAQNLRFYFTEGGLRVVDRTAEGSPELLRLVVVGVGRDGAILPPDRSDVAFAVEAGRLEARGPGLTEIFVNSSAGLRHSIEIAKPPVGDGPLRITLAWRAAGLKIAGHTVEFLTSTGRRLQYGVKATDATGEVIGAEIGVGDGSTLVLVVDDLDAVFPIVVENILTATPNTILEGNIANLGLHANAVGDLNGDGFADVAAMASGWDGGQTNEGAVLVFLGGPGGIVGNGTGPIAAAADAIIESNIAGDFWPVDLQVVGDVNGDGYEDLLVGDTWWDPVNPPATTDLYGAVWLFEGSALGITATSLAESDARIVSDVANASFGVSVDGAGDVNGDGFSDLIVGAWIWEDDPTQTDEGAAFIFHGSAAGITATDINDADSVIEANASLNYAGTRVAGLGDVNGDGFDDVGVAVPFLDRGELDEGAVAVFYGRLSGVAGNPTAPVADAADALIEGNIAGAILDEFAGAGDVNGDGFGDVIIGLPTWEDSPAHSNEGLVVIFHGGPLGIPSNGASALVDVADTVIEGNPNPHQSMQLGYSVQGIGDVNGDGFADVATGAGWYSNPEINEGALFAFHGGVGGIPDSRSDPVVDVADVVIEGDVAGLFLGAAQPGGGDVNGDGYSDLIIPAHQYSSPETHEGAVFIYHGGAAGLSGEPDGQYDAQQQGSHLGYTTASAGDVNGDGFVDLVAGAPWYDVGGELVGRVRVFHGSPGPFLSTPDWTVDGGPAGDRIGFWQASAGDVNGDGYGDLAIGLPNFANGQSLEGRVVVYHGSASGLASEVDWSFESDHADAGFGNRVASAGDVNGDGYGDLVVGATGYTDGELNEGRVYVFFGSPDGLSASPDWTFESDVANAGLGSAVAGVGDVNGDGFADIVVGASGFESGQFVEGAAFGFWGSPAGLPDVPNWFIETNREYSYYGSSVAGLGDVNGDGYGDAIVGAPRDSNPEISEGRAYIYHGSSSGLSTVADRVLERNQAGSSFGWAVVDTGDVNGDGFADVVVGAPDYPSSALQLGRAELFLGSSVGVGDQPAWSIVGPAGPAEVGHSIAGGDHNGDGFSDVAVGVPTSSSGYLYSGSVELYLGNAGAGRPVLARQLRGGDDSTPVQPWGLSRSGDAFQVTMVATSPRGQELARLHVEACPPGVTFGDPACHHAVSADWTAIPVGADGVTLTEAISGLTEGELYHWRVHVLYAPLHAGEPGITPPPNPRHGPWRKLFAQASVADIRVGQPQGVTVSFIEPSSVVPEGGLHAEGAVEVHTSNGAATGLPASVEWATTEGSAVDGQDYVGVTGLIELPSGTPDGHVVPLVVDLIDDDVDEPDEDFGIELFEPVGLVIEQGFHQIWIADDDPEPELAAINVEVAEGAGTAVVELSLSALSAFEIEAHYATQDGTAVAGDDYVAVSGVALIPPMTPATEVTIPILDDADDEPEEVFTLELWDPVNAVLLTPVVTVTILDDDEPSLPFSDGFESGDTSAWSATVP